jgi:hypothetical protein
VAHRRSADTLSQVAVLTNGNGDRDSPRFHFLI